MSTLCAALLAAYGLGQTTPLDPLVYVDTCDASAAVAISATLFVVANDEDNMLRIYRRETAGKPISERDLSEFLDTTKEADLEGGTWIDDRVYWIASHNVGHHERRHRLFATRVELVEGDMRIKPVGEAYDNLLEDMLEDDRLADLGLKGASKIEPKDAGGLNIEGLAATREGELMIGFRNPIVDNKAIVLVLKNPKQVIKGKAAEFRKPILLDVDGLGIRSIEYWPVKNQFLIVAGRFDTERDSRLFRWSGKSDEAPKEICKIDDAWNPEALLLYPGQSDDRVQILSDDGADSQDSQQCKDLPLQQRRFRSGWLKLNP